MSTKTTFPDLTGWEATRDTLHLYSQGVGVVPRAHAEPHPKWWHISLKVQPDGLTTDEMAWPGGGKFLLRMDLKQHQVVVVVNGEIVREISMTEGLTGTEFGNRVLDAVVDLGLSADYARAKFENDEARTYDPAMAEKYLAALVKIDLVFKQHRNSLPGEVGQVQLWPHHFDLAVEWFGTRTMTYEEHGEVQELPAQLNLGFSPGDSGHPAPYFYSNPWPFEKEQLLRHSLPEGARWFTEGWEGSVLPYTEVAGDPRADQRLLDYAQTVYKVASPTLMA